jgi:putative transport protein
MADLLADNALLLLAVCLAVGSLLGTVRIKGVGIGPAAVLVVALALSAWDPRLELPLILAELGLGLFAYCVGVSSGSAFFAALRSGASVVGAVCVVMALAGLVALGAGGLLGLPRGEVAGVYAGALTNTPALAAATEQLDGSAAPTVGYSVTYLGGVLVMLALAGWALGRPSEARGGRPEPGGADPIVSLTVEVTREDGPPLADLTRDVAHPVLVSRRKHGDTLSVPTPDTALERGDLVALIGRPEDVDAVRSRMGVESADHLALDRHHLDMRRMVLSDSRLSGRTVARLGLGDRFGAVATRVRRGDVDLLASLDLVVQQGDRIRVIAPRGRLAEVARYLGDSERGPGDLNPVGLFVGLALGVLVGLATVPLPGGADFALGVAAGPLVVGLVLGRAARTGPIVWSIPHTASTALQQLGALVFLAAAGSRAGGEVAGALSSPRGLSIFVAGLLVTGTAALGLALVGRLGRVGGSRMAGMVAGAQTQPAVLAFARERARDTERVSLGYALVFPAAMLVKILAVQIIALL